MTQYISKSAVLAEIERLDEEKRAFYASDVLHDLEAFIDTLETKEVDLEKELESFFYPHVPWGDYSDHEKEDIIEWSLKIAKHFFELGLNAQKGEQQ